AAAPRAAASGPPPLGPGRRRSPVRLAGRWRCRAADPRGVAGARSVRPVAAPRGLPGRRAGGQAPPATRRRRRRPTTGRRGRPPAIPVSRTGAGTGPPSAAEASAVAGTAAAVGDRLLPRRADPDLPAAGVLHPLRLDGGHP